MGTGAGTHSFEVMLFVGLRGVLIKSDSSGLPNVGVTDSYSRILRFRSLTSHRLLMSRHANCGAQ
jgi:hypothetical protein